MRKLVIGMVGVVALALAACSSGKPSTTGSGNAGNTGGQSNGGGGSGGTGNTGNSGGSGGVGNTGNTGGTGNTGPDCNDWEVVGPDCDTCIIDNCCEAASACLDDDICVDCVTGGQDPECANNVAAADVVECAQASCEAECFPAGPTITPQCTGISDPPSTATSMGACAANMGDCNPVTQEGCDLAAGEACDFGENGFTCYPDGNVHSCGDACGPDADGNYCVGGLTCVGSCARFCCTDADCGPGNTCTIVQDALGVCGTSA